MNSARVRRPASGGLVTAGLLATGGLLVGTLTGCGVAPTGVIDAGEPAKGIKAPGKPAPDVQLYFLGPAGLRPASRPAKAPVDAEEAVQLLMDGPNDAERQRGLSNVLPRFPGEVTVEADAGRIVIRVPMNAKMLSTPALSQLVCTAANAHVPGGKPAAEVSVTVTGGGSSTGPMVCGGNNAFPVIQLKPTHSPSAAPDPGSESGSGTGSASGEDPGSGSSQE
ncbi:hypothetical protein [Streptomyces sp. MST-110588]|uniref:hypothetical protein n=1 Tax=Streptomyces sp. MST-110588 TaxID=2833628 RepID=UPI001F5C42B1|nr:hypothetical protein [Streptomyces sp. MST-110588]UNO43040.1 GerMN domain-containing protein [Streptomyces sp. MST-110588]